MAVRSRHVFEAVLDVGPEAAGHALPRCETALLFRLLRAGYVFSCSSPGFCRLSPGQIAVAIAGVQLNKVRSGTSIAFVDREGARSGSFDGASAEVLPPGCPTARDERFSPWRAHYTHHSYVVHSLQH